MNKKYSVVGLGGTFDELHKGHKTLLDKAFELGAHVQIGLCTDEFAKKLGKKHEIASYEERLKELKTYLQEKGYLDKSEIIPLSDPYGPTVSDNNIEAIVVSRETERAAHAINMLRKEKGLPELKVIVIDMVLAENHNTISTTRIRWGEIDREGRVIK
ncbi:MAG: phosphopantetheine adenylyltransferase [Candidatus Bathyarchaeia archaeon]